MSLDTPPVIARVCDTKRETVLVNDADNVLVCFDNLDMSRASSSEMILELVGFRLVERDTSSEMILELVGFRLVERDTSSDPALACTLCPSPTLLALSAVL